MSEKGKRIKIDQQTTIELLLISISEAPKILGLSKSIFYSFLVSWKIEPTPIRLGDGKSKPLFSVNELRRWVESKDPITGVLPSRERWIEIQKNSDE